MFNPKHNYNITTSDLALKYFCRDFASDRKTIYILKDKKLQDLKVNDKRYSIL